VFNVWVDEVHTFFSQTLTLSELDYDNLNIFGLTATPKSKMFKVHGGSLEFFPLSSVTNAELYRGWADLSIQHEPRNTSDMQIYDIQRTTTYDFVKYVLTDNIELIKKGTNWFVPSDYKIADHCEMKTLLIGYGFAVIVVNGSGIFLTLPDKKMYSFPKNDEFSVKLSSIYKIHDLKNQIVAITGNLCIGEAITIQSNDFLFDYAILSPSGNPEGDSQSAGRIKGNIKKFDNYRECKVFTTKIFNDNATRIEKLVYTLNKIACDKKEKGEDPIISAVEFKDAKKNNGQNDKGYFSGSLELCTELQIILGVTPHKRTKHQAPLEFTEKNDGKNPTREQVLLRWWGLKKDTTLSRMIAIGEEDEWIVYWQPSRLSGDTIIKIEAWKNGE